jgi:hypothetical protein
MHHICGTQMWSALAAEAARTGTPGRWRAYQRGHADGIECVQDVFLVVRNRVFAERLQGAAALVGRAIVQHRAAVLIEKGHVCLGFEQRLDHLRKRQEKK